jgi:GntR family transcriptional regulator
VELDRLARAMGEENVAGGPRVPKYVVLSDQIIGEIEAGNLKPGERLPGEADMAAQLPASLGTIQKALSRLADQGMVERRHGTGTFVADGRQRLIDLWHFRFLADDDETLLPVFATVKDIRTTSVDGPWSRFLGIDGEWVCIERKINVNGEFDCFARFFVSAKKFPGLSQISRHVLDNVSFRSFLKDSYDVTTLRVAEQVAAETMPEDICRVMGLASETTGLVYHLRGFGYRDEPISYQVVYIPPNARRLEFGPTRK